MGKGISKAINKPGLREYSAIATFGGSEALIGADAQQQAAEAMQAEQRRTRELLLGATGSSEAELRAMQQAIGVHERGIERQEALLSAIDPALISAGRQAAQLLRGEEAPLLGVVREQRQRQRQQLEDRLRRQLGTGFATSTPGIQALSEFDRATSQQIATEQQRSLGQLLGTSLQARPGVFGGIQATGQLQQILAAPGQRQAAAIQASPLTQFAGAPFVSDVEKGRFGAQTFGTVLGAAAGAASQGAIGGAGGGAKVKAGV